MEDFYRNIENKTLLLRKDNEFYLSIIEYKVIFTIISNENGIIDLDTQLQKSCTYNDFIKCFETICIYLFEKEKPNKIITKKPAFLKDLFLKDKYEFDGEFLIKFNELKKNRKRG